jgi:AcrR family transcriptional regulator
MAEVSRRAGVGSATLYRNFPSRRELLEALYVDEIDAICHAAATITGESPEAILRAWLRGFYAFVTSKRFVAAALLEHTDRDNPMFGAGRTRVVAASRPLLRAAQDAGQIRADLTPDQILDMVAAIAKIPGSADYREPILRAALDALRPAKDD